MKHAEPVSIERQNLRYHFIEGSLYMASLGILNVQTVYPSLVRRLGGSDIAIGLLPVIAYGAYFLPQILGATAAARQSGRRSFVLTTGLLQRLVILLLGLGVAVFGGGMPALALAVFFLSYTLNQILAGLAAPAWFDFLTKTIPPGMRGRLLGMRTSAGGLLSFLSSLVLTAVFVHVSFPFSYGLVFAMAFVLQISSWFVLRKVAEREPSAPGARLTPKELIAKIRLIVATNLPYRRFLAASALSTTGLISATFFAVSALERFQLDDSAVGLFTAIAVASQVASALALGWLGDRKGYRSTLIVCAMAMVGATSIALSARELWLWYPVFALTGMTYGAEMVSRFNFAVECAPEHDRAIYIGLLNVWLAPWYLTNILGGWIVAEYGYGVLFTVGLIFQLLGLVALVRTQDPTRKSQEGSLAVSSK